MCCVTNQLRFGSSDDMTLFGSTGRLRDQIPPAVSQAFASVCSHLPGYPQAYTNKKMNICFLNWMIAFYNKFVKDLVQVLQLLLKIKVHFIIGCQIIHVQVCFLNLPLACGVFLLLLPLRQCAPGRCSRYTCISLCLFVSLPLPAPTSHLCLVRRHVNKYPSKWGRASASLLEWGLASSCW